MKKFTVYLLLGILLFLSIFIRLKAFPRNPIYISDSALRFRYAKMVAQGEKIPEVDYMLQYPEGIQPSSSDFLTEDKIAGYSYRLLNKILPEMDFAQFLKYFISVLSSLSLLPLFIIGLLVWKNIPASLTGLTFWTFSVGSFGRSVGNYLREEFALPFLFLFIALFIAGIQRKNKFLPFGAGFSLFIALSSWHLSQFFFLVFVVFAWIFFIFCILKRDRQEFQFLLTSLVPILIFSVLSSVLNPPLRVRFFLFSTPMMLLYTLFIAGFLFLKLKLRRVLFTIVSLSMGISGLIISYLITRGDYSHVYLLILSKLRHFAIKPDNPDAIPFDARAIWMGPFNSPNLYSLLFVFAIPFSLGIFPFLSSLKNILKSPVSEKLLFFLFLVFLFLYFLVRRMEVFLIFFLSVYIGGIILIRKKWIYPLIFIAFFIEFYKAVTYPDSVRNPVTQIIKNITSQRESPLVYDSRPDLIFKILKKETKLDDIILARFAVSPMITTYANRATVLQPIFENKHIRQKVKEVMGAFYTSEENLYEICRKNGATVVLYEASILLLKDKDSDRYLTDNLTIPTSSPAYLMHFFPESLHYFTLIFQTDYFRAYRVHSYKDSVEVPKNLIYAPQFDPALFDIKEISEPLIKSRVADEKIEASLRKITEALQNLNRANSLLKKGDIEESLPLFKKVLNVIPLLEQPRLTLANIYLRRSKIEKAREQYAFLAEKYPEKPSYHFNLGMTSFALRDFKTAEKAYKTGLKYDPDNYRAHSELGDVYAFQGKFKEAKKEFEISLKLNPLQKQVREKLKKIKGLP